MANNDSTGLMISRSIGSSILGTLLVGLIDGIILYLACNLHYLSPLLRERLIIYLTFPVGSLICGAIAYKFIKNSMNKKIIFAVIAAILSYPALTLIQMFFVIGGC